MVSARLVHQGALAVMVVVAEVAAAAVRTVIRAILLTVTDASLEGHTETQGHLEEVHKEFVDVERVGSRVDWDRVVGKVAVALVPY